MPPHHARDRGPRRGQLPAEKRSSAYGLIAASGAVAVAAGPLIGGAVTTFASWRYVFAGEVVLVILILPVLRRIEDARRREPGSTSSARCCPSRAWAWSCTRAAGRRMGMAAQPTRGPKLLGLSPVCWLVLAGLLVIYASPAGRRA
ncbi:MFS transporter [Rhodococcus hoagii]|nr:MFS transporter [Prescottella equi]